MMRSKCLIGTLVIGIGLLAACISAQSYPVGLPSPPQAVAVTDPRLPLVLDKIRRAKILDSYQQAITLYKTAGRYDDAARLHREQVPIYLKRQLNDAAIVHSNAAANLESQLRFFVETPTTAKGAGKLFTGARLEPLTGCYLGAFIDRDSNLGPSFLDENYQAHRTPAQFLNATGRHPGTLFMYLAYGQPVPLKWLQTLKAQGTIPIISWEPRNLDQVQDDVYLNSFARALDNLDWPVFIRFASEMNGKWTSYHRDPVLYRQKFRLVNRVMHHLAPRVATMWIVNNPPLGNADAYYPGDDGCDWVGLNFYAVPYFENKRSRPAFDVSPLTLLDPIYKKYAARKPIAIGEFAASNFSVVDHKPIPNFAIEKMRLVYESLPLLYPRVKMINWFDMDTRSLQVVGKTRNDYRLTSSLPLLKAFQNSTNTTHYLQTNEQLSQPITPIFRPLNGQRLDRPTQIRVWAKAYGHNPKVFIALDGKIIQRAAGSGAAVFILNTQSLAAGNHHFTAYLYDDKNRFQRRADTSFFKP